MELYEKYKDDDDCKQRLEEILSMYSVKETLNKEQAKVVL